MSPTSRGRDPKTAPGFSVANLLLHREYQLSWVFAHLLDPDANHDQGDAFLAVLLEELGDRSPGVWSPPGAGVTVTTEHSASVEMPDGEERSGRIDILIKREDCRRIAIENKPWAWDQDQQVERYLRWLQDSAREAKKGCDSFLLLYWSGNGTAPAWSNDREPWMEKRCITMPYKKNGDAPSVEGWLGRCVKACEAEPVKLFLNDLIGYVRRWFPDETHRLEDQVKELNFVKWPVERPKGWLSKQPCWDGDWPGIWIYRPNQSVPRFEVGASGWPDDNTRKRLLAAGQERVGGSRFWEANEYNREGKEDRQHVSWTFDAPKVFLEGHPAEGIDEIMKLAKALMNAVPAG